MKRLRILLLVVVVAYLLFVNLTSGYFDWGCNGEVRYQTNNRCQLLPKTHSKNIVNRLLLSLNFFDFNKQKPSQVQQVKNSSVKESTLCDFEIKLPKNYYFQDPINSFYGYTHTKSGVVGVCKVILGPNFKIGHEGFVGEQIQINSYPSELTLLSELTKEIEFSKKYSNLNVYRFSKESYGGLDEVMILPKKNIIYEVIWRGQTDNMEKIVLSIVSQL